MIVDVSSFKILSAFDVAADFLLQTPPFPLFIRVLPRQSAIAVDSPFDKLRTGIFNERQLLVPHQQRK
jgi:hypothetical protein